jgi:hypothetical protein
MSYGDFGQRQASREDIGVRAQNPTGREIDIARPDAESRQLASNVTLAHFAFGCKLLE